jgi:hypothetical protein
MLDHRALDCITLEMLIVQIRQLLFILSLSLSLLNGTAIREKINEIETAY